MQGHGLLKYSKKLFQYLCLVFLGGLGYNAGQDSWKMAAINNCKDKRSYGSLVKKLLDFWNVTWFGCLHHVSSRYQ